MIWSFYSFFIMFATSHMMIIGLLAKKQIQALTFDAVFTSYVTETFPLVDSLTGQTVPKKGKAIRAVARE